MPEARGISLLLMASLLIFLSWGVDSGWRQALIEMESRWLIDCYHTRAYALGHAVDLELRAALGPLVSQPQGSWGEGWVLGLRQVMTRISAQGPLFPLLALGVMGAFIDAACRRRQRASRFIYTSPLSHRRLQRLIGGLVTTTLWIALAPIPMHPLFLLSLLLSVAATAAAGYAAFMKQM